MSTQTTDATALAWSRIVARGADAESYLQGQLSQDLATIDDSGSWSLILRPDGVVIAACFVTREDDAYSLALPRDLADEAFTRLRRFLLRLDCSLEQEDVATGPFVTARDQIDAGWPGPAEFAAELVPQSFGATFVAATVSFTKGCFTGQELVGRLDARGSSVPWRLVRAHGPSESRIDEILHSRGPAGPQGVTTSSRDANGLRALGLVHRTLLEPTALAELTDVTLEAL